MTRHALAAFAVDGVLWTVGGCTTALRDSPVVERRRLCSIPPSGDAERGIPNDVERVDEARALRRLALPLTLSGAWLALYAAWTALQPWGERGATVFGDTAYLLPIAVATALSAWAWRRTFAGLRVFWGIVTLSNALWLAAEVLWSARELSGGEVPFPWWTDAGYLASYALLAAAVPVAFRPSLRTVSAGALLDAGVVVSGLALLWWWVVLRPLSFSLDLASVVGFAYPSFGLVLLGTLVATRLVPARRGTLALALVSGAVASAALADGLYTPAVVTDTHLSGDWIGLGWQAEACLLALAALTSGRGLDRRSDWVRAVPSSEVHTGLVVAGGLGIAVLAVGVEAARGSLGAISVGGSVLVAGLALARAAVLTASEARASLLRDPATGAFEPAYFVEQLRAAVRRARRFDEPFVLALAESAHADPAAVKRLVEALRDVDVVGRLADDRLAVLVPRVDAGEAYALGEQIREVLGSARGGRRGAVGVAVCEARGAEDAEELLDRADVLLAAARSLGGDHVRGPEADVLLSTGTPDAAVRAQLERLVAALDAGSGHSARVAWVAGALAREAGYEEGVCEAAELVGLLHDAGRLLAPATRLDERGSRSADLAERIPAVRALAPALAAIAEAWDGSGQPRGLCGDAIPAPARVVAVADALLSMLEDRPHRRALSLTSTLTEIWRRAGGRYDPAIVGALFRLLRAGRLDGLAAADVAATVARSA